MGVNNLYYFKNLVIWGEKVDENSNIIEIENEYKRIDSKWLRLHYLTSVGLVLFAFLIECILGLAFFNLGNIDLSIEKYILKYILSPLVLNAIFIIIGCWAIHTVRLTQDAKVYIVSLLFVAICFVYFTVHSIFTSLFVIFTVPMLLTIVYGNYLLTTVTALLSISAKIISELFITWDPDKLNIFDSDLGLTNFIISLSILCAFYVVCIVVIRFEREKNAASIQKEIERYQLQERLQTDELTAINNRTALRNAFQSIEEDASENTYIFVMIDLDNFKILNDTLGHDIGDQCLNDFGNILKTNCIDATPFRFGGDEFCILFKNQTLKAVLETCERIQEGLKENAVLYTIDVPLTASFGIAHYSSEMTTAQLMKNTDSALYRSKTVKDAIYIYDDQER